MSTRRMFILRRPFSSLLLLMVAALAILARQYRVNLQAFPTIISAYTAKEYCSCRYVMNNSGSVLPWLHQAVSAQHAGRRRQSKTGHCQRPRTHQQRVVAG